MKYNKITFDLLIIYILLGLVIRDSKRITYYDILNKYIKKHTFESADILNLLYASYSVLHF